MKMKKMMILFLPVFAVVGLILFNACKDAPTAGSGTAVGAGLTIPEGFSAVAIAQNTGSPRHMVVTPENDLYVHLANNRKGKSILVYHIDGDKATLKSTFGDFGGTGIAIKDGYLYASDNTDVFRFKLNDKNEVANPNQPERIVTGLIGRRMHEPKAICLDNDGNVYVNIGAYSNICSDFDPKKTGSTRTRQKLFS